jgi:hypothetical protein
MNLDEAQRQRVTAWILEGAKLSEIQNRLLAEFGVKCTYMEVRFLVDDLKLIPKDPEPPKVVAPPVSPPPAGPAKLTVEKNPAPEETLPASGSNVSVSVDQLAKPGAIVSGNVTFSDGHAADWYLDQTGRLGVVPKQTGYKPSAADVQQFQTALQNEIAKLGF